MSLRLILRPLLDLSGFSNAALLVSTCLLLATAGILVRIVVPCDSPSGCLSGPLLLLGSRATGSQLAAGQWPDDAISAWQNGSLSVEELHVALDLHHAIVPALFQARKSAPVDGPCGPHGFCMRKPIPVVGIVTMNGGDMVRRLIYSIDVPVMRIHIVVNKWAVGDGSVAQSAPGAAEDDGLDAIQAELGERFVRVQRLGCNRGCAGGWNTVIWNSLDAPWWLLVNDDAAFTPGALAGLVDMADRNPDAGAVLMPGFRVFLLRRQVVSSIGVFDENIWPAYHEDCEYHVRMKVAGVQYLSHGPPGYDHIHGSGNTSGTLTSSFAKGSNVRVGYSSGNNAVYVHYKWNTAWDTCGQRDDATWQRPFGNGSGGSGSEPLWRWRLDRSLRGRSMSLWNFSVDVQAADLVEDFSHKFLPISEAVALPRGKPLVSLWPVRHILYPISRQPEKLGAALSLGEGGTATVCASPFAKLEGRVPSIAEWRLLRMARRRTL